MKSAFKTSKKTSKGLRPVPESLFTSHLCESHHLRHRRKYSHFHFTASKRVIKVVKISLLPMNSDFSLLHLFTIGFLALDCSALEIEIKYNLDNSKFFDVTGRKEALEAAAAFYEDIITDQLEEIDPSSFDGVQRHWKPTYLEPGNNTPQAVPEANDLIVPADTIIIFAGARSLSTAAQGGPGGVQFQHPITDAWINQLTNRGEEGAITYANGKFSSSPSDVAPWGGTIFFNEDLTWNTSITDSSLPGDDFISVALHEIGHVLGIGDFGTFISSWIPLVSGSKFQGPFSKLSNGNVEPGLNGGVHWSASLTDSRTLPVFGRNHGEAQRPLMLATIGSTTPDQFAVPTDLDLAALRDIGWELSTAPEDFAVEVNFDSAAPSIGIPTTTGVNYQVLRSDSPAKLAPTGATIIGDGTVQTWTDPEGSVQRAFFCVEAFDASSSSSKVVAPSLKKSAEIVPDLSEDGFPILRPSQCGCPIH